jgi:methyl-accepting chemotaxis protein
MIAPRGDLPLISLKNMSLSLRLSLLVGLFMLGFIAFAAMSYDTMNTVKVDGPLYKRVIQGKDAIADVLPPPEYIIESYLTVLQMLDDPDKATLDKLIKDGEKLRKQYDERHEHWLKDLPDGELRQAMVKESYDPAIEFFDIRDKQFIPALLDGDKARALAIARTQLKPAYERHRAGVDHVVTSATTFAEKNERTAREIVASRRLYLLILGGIVIAIVLFIAWQTRQIARDLTERIEKATAAASRVASGDLTLTIGPTSGDETGRLLEAIQVMTNNLNALVASRASSSRRSAWCRRRRSSARPAASRRRRSTASAPPAPRSPPR